MKSHFAVSALLLCALPQQAAATISWCGVFDNSSDKYLNLREGPGANSKVVGRVSKQDFLSLEDGMCRAGVCAKDKTWVFVEGVNSPTEDRPSVQGWVKSKFIRDVWCPGYDQ